MRLHVVCLISEVQKGNVKPEKNTKTKFVINTKISMH